MRDKLQEVQEKVDASLRDNLDTPAAIFQLETLIRAANLYRTARDSGLRTGGTQYIVCLCVPVLQPTLCYFGVLESGLAAAFPAAVTNALVHLHEQGLLKLMIDCHKFLSSYAVLAGVKPDASSEDQHGQHAWSNAASKNTCCTFPIPALLYSSPLQQHRLPACMSSNRAAVGWQGPRRSACC